MLRLCAVAGLVSLALASTLHAEGRELLGQGRLTTNDLIGDGRDRWQTGSVVASRVVGHGWAGALPQKPFDVLEYRFGGQVIAPASLTNPVRGDRPYAGVLSLGVHTHFQRGPVEMSLGLDAVATGPRTRLDALQTAIHDGIGISAASDRVLDRQIENNVYPTVVAEGGRSITLGGQAMLRPFAEARWGVETMLRAGADLTIGTVGLGELLVRDPVTGQRYRSVTNPVAGLSYVVGGDVAYVDSSNLLPADRGYRLTDTRNRLRAGVHWQGQRNSAFYGLTYLSEEFEAQGSGQFLGSVRLDFRF